MRGLLRAAVAELADAQDLGSCIFPMYGFKSHRPHYKSPYFRGFFIL